MFIKVLFRTFASGTGFSLSKPDGARPPCTTPCPKPLELHAHAMDNLQYIRRTLERAGEFTAVPGLGGVLMGSTALAAAWIAGPQTASARWLAVWLAGAAAGLLIGI